MPILWNSPPEWWQLLIVCIGLIVALSLGYGEKRPSYWYKFMIGISYSIPFLAIGFNYWMLITPIAFIVLFKLSNTSLFEKLFVWKICEFLFGTNIGITAALFVNEISEWLAILAMASGGILFAAGGTHIPKIGGQKWIRRFALPAVLTGILTALKRRK